MSPFLLRYLLGGRVEERMAIALGFSPDYLSDAAGQQNNNRAYLSNAFSSHSAFHHASVHVRMHYVRGRLDNSNSRRNLDLENGKRDAKRCFIVLQHSGTKSGW